MISSGTLLIIILYQFITDMVNTRISDLTVSELYSYLDQKDLSFVPPLQGRLDLLEYSEKLNKYAIHFCAYSGSRLISFMGCYFNDPDKEFGYISTSSVVKEYQNMGIAKKILEDVIRYAADNGFRRIFLKVYNSNIKARNLYSGYGFSVSKINQEQTEMVLNISD